MATYCNDHEYRFITAQGLERRKICFRTWSRVTGAMFEQMTADELEHCANVMRSALRALDKRLEKPGKGVPR